MDRLIRGTAIAFVVFGAIFAFFVGQRVDQVTIALIGGVLIGLLVTLPALATVLYLAMRAGRAAEAVPSRQHLYAPMPQPPPQYWISPQSRQVEPNGFPSYDSPQSFVAPPAFQLPPQRKFFVIGDNGEVSEAS